MGYEIYWFKSDLLDHNTLKILNNSLQDLKISIYSAALDLDFWVKRHAQN